MQGEHADIDGRLRALLAQRLRLDPGVTVDDRASLQDLGLDSAALLSVVVGIEETFGIEVPDGEITVDNFGSVGAMSSYIVGTDNVSAARERAHAVDGGGAAGVDGRAGRRPPRARRRSRSPHVGRARRRRPPDGRPRCRPAASGRTTAWPSCSATTAAS